MIKLVYRVLSLGLFMVLCIAGSTLAQQSSTHKVKSGETLFGIAEKEHVSVQKLKQWNDLSGSQLSIGQTLIIKKQAASNRTESGKVHTVEAHETLYSISKRYGVSIPQLKKWNDLKGKAIHPDDKLTIKQTGKTSGSRNENGETRINYTVKSGDSLFRIAHAHQMSVARLKDLNNLSSNNIQVGQKLVLQPTDQAPSVSTGRVKSTSQGKFIRYTLKKRQRREALLDKFNMDSSEFAALNPGVEATVFQKGDHLTLLAPADHHYKNPYVEKSTSEKLGSASVTEYTSNDHEPTTSGELYNPKALTAAHAQIALGSVIFVKNPRNGRGVFVRVNDRTTRDGLEVSKAVWQALHLTNAERVTMYRTHE